MKKWFLSIASPSPFSSFFLLYSTIPCPFLSLFLLLFFSYLIFFSLARALTRFHPSTTRALSS